MSGFGTLARVALCRTPRGALLRRVPGVPQAYARWALHTPHTGGLFFGSYPSHAAAVTAIPRGRSIGWDNEGSAGIFDGRLPDQPSVYPVLFWLERLLRPGDRLVDFGGGIGITFYQHRARASLPDGARWIIVEVPAIAARGAAIAAERGEAALDFVTSLGEAGACDILLSAGALQYIDRPTARLLDDLPARPRHILLNKLPLTAGPEFWTLQNFGPAVSPYHVFNREELFGTLDRLGYHLADRWRIAELQCDIPFHPQHFLAEKDGLLFTRNEWSEGP